MRDSQNKQIEVGQEVAFNYSGDVVPGRVDFVGQTAKIMHTTGVGGILVFPPRRSTVRNGRSILVLS